MKKPTIIFSLLLLLFLSPANLLLVGAETTNSVKECLDNPEKCEKPTSPEKEIVPPAEETSYLVDIVKMVGAFIFVLLLLFIILRYLGKRNQQFQGNRMIVNLGGAHLGNNRSIQVVKIGNEVYVVGVGENVNLLKQIENHEEANHLLQTYENSLIDKLKARDVVTKWMEKKESPSSSFQEALKKQLSDMTKNRSKAFTDVEKKGTKENE